MSDVVIGAEGLGKSYLIGHQTERERYTALRDVLSRSARGLARSAMDMVRGRQLVAGDEVEEIWALKDVSFEIRRGEVVGIIGRNGAGKSTLLKILSRITEPSAGRVEIKGRVASLLEVGTGFHPELTGRENIYLNGAILGMSRAEIKRKFDEIVAFAEVEKFLDTPVKRYSSGMYVRLAFAVAAHLEPEILVVDEVLAVGDAEFQKKCLGKMEDVAGHGRTVLFVSHSMAAIRKLCSRSILLANGGVAFKGDSGAAVSAYLHVAAVGPCYRRPGAPSGRPSILEAASTRVEWDGATRRSVLPIQLVLVSPSARAVNLDLRLKDDLGTPIAFATIGALDSATKIALREGETRLDVRLDVSSLAVGSYSLSFDVTTPWVECHDRVEDCLMFSIDPEHWRSSLHPLHQALRRGSVLLNLDFRIPA